MTKQFVEKVRRSEIAMRPVLPLALPVDLGHVGMISDDGAFNQLGTIGTMLGLNSLGGELPKVQSPIRVSVTSGRNVSVSFGVDAKTDGALSRFANLGGKASIEFGSSDSFFLAADGLQIRQLTEPQLLVNAMLSAYERGQWKKEWYFIHRIGIARKLTVILAKEAETTVLLKAAAKVAASAVADVDLATGFKFVAATKAVTQITGGRNVAAFYDAYRVRDGWFSKPKLAKYSVDAFGVDLDAYPREVARVSDANEAFARA
jgi:hypothetical protein